MESKTVTIKHGTFINVFLLYESKEKELMSFSDFVQSVGLRSISKRNIDGVGHTVYEIVDEPKWFLAKIKYGI